MLSTKNRSLSSNNTVLVVRYTTSASEPPVKKSIFIFIYEIEYEEEDLKASPAALSARERLERAVRPGPGRRHQAGV